MSMMTVERARRAVMDALNGDAEKVDPALRRALIAVAAHLDEHADESAREHKAIRDDVRRLTRLAGVTATTFVAALITGIVNLIIN